MRERRKEQLPSESKVAETKATIDEILAKEDHGFSLLDAFRTLFAGALFLGLLGYFVTRDNSLLEPYRPAWTRPEVVKNWFVRHLPPALLVQASSLQKGMLTIMQKGPVEYTDADLRKFNGEDPDKPIFLAINGTIYDVSAGRRHYGPKGSYHLLAGVDASRAFVTNCFKEDRTPDMRGVEEMFLPFDDPEVDSLYSQAEFDEQKRL